MDQAPMQSPWGGISQEDLAYGPHLQRVAPGPGPLSSYKDTRYSQSPKLM